MASETVKARLRTMAKKIEVNPSKAVKATKSAEKRKWTPCFITTQHQRWVALKERLFSSEAHRFKLRTKYKGDTELAKVLLDTFTLRNSSGQLVVRILDYGGVINEINVPDRHGNVADVTLGCDDMEGYETRSRFFGALIGRVANRIAGGQFTLDGKTYTLCVNNWPNSLHGGQVGFHKKVWTSRVEGDSLVLTYVSPDGEENYPGEVTTKVVYRVTDDNELSIEYEATTTKPTPLNLTNHAYFNLAGHDSGILADNVVTIAADSYLPIDDTSIPTGEVRPVDGTEYDLRRPVRLGDRMHEVRTGKGFDHNFCLAPSDGKVRLAARLEHPPSGRYMECRTTEPGLQFYTGGNLQGQRGKGVGASYEPFSALVMEAQHYPDSVNHPSFPNTIVRPGETYRQTTVYTFGVA